MNETRTVVSMVGGAVVSMLLQIVIAPAIQIFSAMPNFPLVFCLLVAVARPFSQNPILPFAVGLASDICFGTPVGSSALAFVLVCFVASRAFAALNNDTVFVPLFIIAVSAFLTEAIVGLFALSFGAAPDIVSAFAYRILPCGLYDCVIGLVFYPLAMRLFAPPSPMGPTMASQL